MANILKIRSLEGKSKDVLINNSIRNHMSELYIIVHKLNGSLRDTNISLLTDEDLDKLLQYIELSSTDSFAITTNDGQNTLRIFKRTQKMRDNWSIIIETAKSYGAIYDFNSFNFDNPNMGFIFIDDIVHHLIK